MNTPESGLCKCLANHIVNWTGGAAWFGQHFWDYYRFTGDEAYLREHVMPYLYEVALFYEDFAVENADGYYDLYPSTSPENTPQNVWDENGYNIETVKNASMEHALLREVLTHLLEGARITGLYADKVPQWEKMRTKCRPYRINDDGAIAEWLDLLCRSLRAPAPQPSLSRIPGQRGVCGGSALSGVLSRGGIAYLWRS